MTHNEFFSGSRRAFPIVTAYLVAGAAAGALGVSNGMSVAEVGLLSLILFAGSGQFVFAEIYMGAPLQLVSTIFFVNLRHFLYSTVLAQQTRRLPWQTRAAIGAQLTDETFLVSASHFKGRMMSSGAWMLGLNITSYSSWFLGNISGALLGENLNLSVIGVDFVGIAMLIALLCLNVTDHHAPKAASIVAALAGGGAVCLQWVYPNPSTTVIVAVVVSTLGVIIFGANSDDSRFAEQIKNSDER